MSEIEYDEWMSESDALLWNIERDPLLRSTVTSVWFLESAPTSERMHTVVERMVRHLPRLRQRVVADSSGIATPRWEEDPHFDLTYHHRRLRLPGAAPGADDLLALAQHTASRAFDKDRPLWEMSIVEGLPDGRAAFVMTVHHAIADGLGMVNMLQHMVELGPEDTDEAAATPDSTPPADVTTGPSAARRSVARRIQTEAQAGLRIGKATMKAASGIVRDPIGAARDVARTSASVAHLVKPSPTPLSGLMTGRSMTPNFGRITLGLDDFKAAAKTAGGTINDAFVSSVMDGLDRYHRERGGPSDELRMAMPVSIRTDANANAATNQFVPARVTLPLMATSTAARLLDIRTHLADVRAEPALPFMNDISAMIGRLGPAASVNIVGAMMKGVDITTSNVPGPPFPVWMAGARVDEFFAFGPLAGAAVNITLFSYNGILHLGINSDARAVDDPQLLIECLQAGFDATLALVS